MEDYSNMCLGSEMLGTRASDKRFLRCKECDQLVLAFSNTENLVPVHNKPKVVIDLEKGVDCE